MYTVLSLKYKDQESIRQPITLTKECHSGTVQVRPYPTYKIKMLIIVAMTRDNHITLRQNINMRRDDMQQLVGICNTIVM